MKTCSFLALAVTVAAIAVLAQPAPASAADLDCGDFSSQAEAQESLSPGDPHGLDGDSDGIACEDNPCPCITSSGGGGGGSTQPAAPPPYRLEKSAARAEAQRLARRFVRRSAQVTVLAFGGCNRLGLRRIDCRFTAHGITATTRTTCGLRVAVRAKDRQPVARLASTQCRTESTLFLTYERARQAMLETAEPIAGKRVGLQLSRLNKLEFEGVAEWQRPGQAPGKSESCSLDLLAELLPSDVVRVQRGEPVCRVIVNDRLSGTEKWALLGSNQ